MMILIVGENSFIAKHFIAECKRNGVAYAVCNHGNVPVEIDIYDWVVNFSLNPRMFSDEYSESIDQDFLICKAVANCSAITKYALISSRVVYGDQNTLVPILETAACEKNNPRRYGENKLISEKKCQKILNEDRLLIVRASNIFGLELGRHTFMGIAQTRLIEKSEIMLDISKETKRDFIPVTEFSLYLLKLIMINTGGLFNVGSGCGVGVGDICAGILNGYGGGKLIELDGVKIKDQFILNVQKIKGLIPIDISSDSVLDYCYDIGCQLRKVKNELQ